MNRLKQFLEKSSLIFHNASHTGIWKDLGFVLGNVSCDMDSFVGAVLLSHYLSLN